MLNSIDVYHVYHVYHAIDVHHGESQYVMSIERSNAKKALVTTVIRAKAPSTCVIRHNLKLLQIL